MTLDSSSLSLLLVLFLAGVGFLRGVRAEGITLAGILAAAVVFGTDPMRQRILGVVNKMPRVIDMLLAPEGTAVAMGTGNSGLIRSPDQKLLFYLALFLVSLGVFYVAGSVFGGRPERRLERMLGWLTGGLSGFVISLTLIVFSQDYLSRHPNLEPISFRLPTLFTPTLPRSSSLMQYAPLVFMAALFMTAFMVLTSFLRPKR